MVRKKWKYIIGASLIVFMNCRFAFGEENKTVIWDKFLKNSVPADKVWKIEFNQNVSEKELDKYFSIIDKDGEKQGIQIISQGKEVKVVPVERYESGEEYKLIVEEDVESGRGEKLNSKIVVPFVVDDYMDEAGKSIEEALKNAELEVELSQFHMDKEELERMVEEIVNSTPEIFYYNGMSYTFNIDSEEVQKVKFNYAYSSDKIGIMRKELKEKIDYIAENVIEEDMSEFEKELAVHDYIIKNSEYDINGLENGTLEKDSYEMYGLLVKGKSVCSGYAKTMQYFLDEIGIKNELLFGTANGNKHVWNLIELDGELYHLDATFDDPVSKEGNVLRRSYFNITDEMIARNHQWEKDESKSAEGVQFNYFVKMGLVAGDKEEALQILKEELKNKQEISIMYSGDKSDVVDIIKSIGYNGKIVYSYDESTEVLTVQLK